MSDSPEEEAVLEADAKDYHATIAAEQSGESRKKIPLVEMFGPTIQGEGSIIGQQSYFLRFGLCDYRCTMCDSLHAVIPTEVRRNAEWLTQEEIFGKFWDFRPKDTTHWVTFSGGNPLLHNLGELSNNMRRNGLKINVETQGTLYQEWVQKANVLTISPKGPGMGEVTNIRVLDDFIDQVLNNWGIYQGRPASPDTFGYGPKICLKIVAFDQRDLDFAAEIFERYWAKLPDHDESFYLSLGNPKPPVPHDNSTYSESDVREWKDGLIDQYKILFDEIKGHRTLSQVRFLPQWHALVWGNGNGH